MIRGIYTSSAGMQVEALRQEAIANNLANLNTSGFKKDMATISARENMHLSRTNNPAAAGPQAATHKVGLGDLGTGVLLDRFYKNFEQGELHQTENPLDVAIQGEGFFTVENPDGEKLYTRSGDFTRDNQGRLADKDGRLVMGQSGAISLPDGKFAVGEDGSVSVDGRTFDKLAIVKFADPNTDLAKVGDTLFRAQPDATPEEAAPSVAQGMLEGANVNSVREMVEMIACLRQYESNQRALTSQDETLQKAVNDVGRG